MRSMVDTHSQDLSYLHPPSLFHDCGPWDVVAASLFSLTTFTFILKLGFLVVMPDFYRDGKFQVPGEPGTVEFLKVSWKQFAQSLDQMDMIKTLSNHFTTQI